MKLVLLMFTVPLLSFVYSNEKRKCSHFSKVMSEKADYYINGLFPVYESALSKKRFSRNGVLYMEIVKFTLEQLNKNSTYKIGYKFYDTCGESQLHITTEIAMDIVLNDSTSDPKTKTQCTCKTKHLDYDIGIVGPDSSSVSVLLSDLLLPDKIPQISYVSTSTELNDKTRYKYFLRTIPDDTQQVQAIFDLVKAFDWKYVSLVASDNIYGRTALEMLTVLFKAENICFGVHTLFSVPYNNEELSQITKKLEKEDKAEVIIVWGLTVPTVKILRVAERLSMYNRTWIFTEAFAQSSVIHRIDPRVISGSFSIKPVSGKYPEFEDYFFNLKYPKPVTKNPWLARFFDTQNVTKLQQQYITVGDFKELLYGDKIGYVRNSVMAYATALKAYVTDYQNLTYDNNNQITKFPPISNRSLFFHDYLTKVKFPGINKDTVEFDEFGNIKDATYEIINFQKSFTDNSIIPISVAMWRKGKHFEYINRTKIIWSTKQQPVSHCSLPCIPGTFPVNGSKSCCWKCVTCRKDFIKVDMGSHKCVVCPVNTFANKQHTKCLKIHYEKTLLNKSCSPTVYVFVSISSFSVVLVIFVFFCHRYNPVVKASNFILSMIQLSIQFILSFWGLVGFHEVSVSTCSAVVYTYGFLFSALLSIILMKTDFLIMVFNRKVRLVKQDFIKSRKRQILIFFIITGGYIIGHLLFTYLFPVEVKQLIDTNTRTRMFYCGNRIATITTSLYLLFISLICGVQTFHARNIPSKYNEGKVIMYSVFILVVCLVVISMLQVTESTGQTLVFLTFVMLFTSNYLLLVSMFFIKIYHIVVDEKDGGDGHRKKRFIGRNYIFSKTSFIFKEI